MHTATHQTTKHVKSIIKTIRQKDELPFTDFLPANRSGKYFAEITHRNRIFTPELTLFGFLSQAIGADQSCQSAVSQIISYQISQGIEPPSSNTAAYCKARSRLPENMLSGLTKEAAQEIEEQVDSKWLWRGKNVKLVDGSTISMPDTFENQSSYPQPSSQKKELVFQ
jgi:hypothetical protein